MPFCLDIESENGDFKGAGGSGGLRSGGLLKWGVEKLLRLKTPCSRVQLHFRTFVCNDADAQASIRASPTYLIIIIKGIIIKGIDN